MDLILEIAFKIYFIICLLLIIIVLSAQVFYVLKKAFKDEL